MSKMQPVQDIVAWLKEFNKKNSTPLSIALEIRFQTFIHAQGKKTNIETLLQSEMDFLLTICRAGEASQNILPGYEDLGARTGTLDLWMKMAVQTLLKQAGGENDASPVQSPESPVGRLTQLANIVLSRLGRTAGLSKEDLFFKAIHQYGLVAEFENKNYIAQFPIEFRQKYNAWKEESKGLVSSYQELHAPATPPQTLNVQAPAIKNALREIEDAQGELEAAMKKLNEIGQAIDNQQSAGDKLESGVNAVTESKGIDAFGSLEALKQKVEENLAKSKADNDATRIRFYEFQAKELCTEGFFDKNGKQTDNAWDVRDKDITNTVVPFIRWALQAFPELGEDERKILKKWTSELFYSKENKIRKFLESKSSNAKRDYLENDFVGGIVAKRLLPSADLFHLSHLLELQENLYRMLQLFPKSVLKAYSEWKDNPKTVAFKIACKEGRFADAHAMVVPKDDKGTPAYTEVDDESYFRAIVVKIRNPVSLETSLGIEDFQFKTLGDLITVVRSLDNQKLRGIYLSMVVACVTGDINEAVKERKKIFQPAIDGYKEFAVADIQSIKVYFKRFLYSSDIPIVTGQRKNAIKQYSGNSFFQFIHLYGLADIFEAQCENSFIPVKVKQEYKAWKRTPKNQTFIAECAARKNPPVEALPAPAVEAQADLPVAIPAGANDNEAQTNGLSASPIDPRLFIHESKQPLVVKGARTDSTGIAPVDKVGTEIPTEKKVIENINKTKNLYTAMLADNQITRIDVYRDVRTQEDDQKTTHPYDIVQIEKDDGSLTRVLVCDFENHLTYVERDTQPYTKGDIVEIAGLLRNQKVWTARHAQHLNGEMDKTWLEKIQIIFNADLSTFPVEYKFKNNNSDLANALINHFATAVMMTGSKPAARDGTLFILGTKITSWARLYHALQDKTIEGLEGCRTYNELFNYLAKGTDAPMPWLLKFENKPQITAQMIVKAVECFETELSEQFTPYYNNDISVDGPDLRTDFKNQPDMRRNGHDIDLALRFGAVADPDGVLPEGVRIPTDLAQFLRLVRPQQGQSALDLVLAA